MQELLHNLKGIKTCTSKSVTIYTTTLRHSCLTFENHLSWKPWARGVFSVFWLGLRRLQIGISRILRYTVQNPESFMVLMHFINTGAAGNSWSFENGWWCDVVFFCEVCCWDEIRKANTHVQIDLTKLQGFPMLLQFHACCICMFLRRVSTGFVKFVLPTEQPSQDISGQVCVSFTVVPLLRWEAVWMSMYQKEEVSWTSIRVGSWFLALGV